MLMSSAGWVKLFRDVLISCSLYPAIEKSSALFLFCFSTDRRLTVVRNCLSRANLRFPFLARTAPPPLTYFKYFCKCNILPFVRLLRITAVHRRFKYLSLVSAIRCRSRLLFTVVCFFLQSGIKSNLAENHCKSRVVTFNKQFWKQRRSLSGITVAWGRARTLWWARPLRRGSARMKTLRQWSRSCDSHIKKTFITLCESSFQ